MIAVNSYFLLPCQSCGIYVATNPNEFENPRRIPLDVNDFGMIWKPPSAI